MPATDELDTDAVKAAIVEALRTVYDPEIPVSLYELGLIYDIIVAPDFHDAVEFSD